MSLLSRDTAKQHSCRTQKMQQKTTTTIFNWNKVNTKTNIDVKRTELKAGVEKKYRHWEQ